jgi:tryptophan-rich sensory protein
VIKSGIQDKEGGITMKYLIISAINLLAFLFMISTNYFFPESRNVSKISDSINAFITPAGYAFSIWGLIFLLLALYAIRQFFAKGIDKEIYEKVGLWFALNVIFNGLWSPVFGSGNVALSLVIILGVLVTLIVIYTKTQNATKHHSWLMRLPFSIYIGWVSVATIVNVFTLLKYKGITELFGVSEYGWTIIMLLVGGLLSIYFTLKNRDIAYSLVFIWAYIAIIVQRQDMHAIVITASISIVLIIIFIIVSLIRRKKRLS